LLYAEQLLYQEVTLLNFIFCPFIAVSLFPLGIFVGSASKVIGITEDFTEVSS
jgi:hypothetical protein